MVLARTTGHLCGQPGRSGQGGGSAAAGCAGQPQYTIVVGMDVLVAGQGGCQELAIRGNPAALHRQVVVFRKPLQQQVHLLEQLLHLRQKALPGLRQDDRLGGPGHVTDEQGRTQRIFQLPDLSGQGRLADEQPLCRPPKVQLFGQNAEISELPKCDWISHENEGSENPKCSPKPHYDSETGHRRLWMTCSPDISRYPKDISKKVLGIVKECCYGGAVYPVNLSVPDGAMARGKRR